MTGVIYTLVALIGVALLFDFLNGLHDAANSISTNVSTRVLSPRYAVAWAGFFNFVAFFFFCLHVAHTVGSGIIDQHIVEDRVIFGALSGAIVGIGAVRRNSAVRWSVAQDIVVAWVLTLPASGLMAALAHRPVGVFA